MGLHRFSATVLLMAFLAAAVSADAQDSRRVLSAMDERAESPRVAATAGGECAVAWVAAPRDGEGPRRVVLRKRTNGTWDDPVDVLPPTASPDAAPPEPREASLAMNAAGEMRLVWVSEDESGASLIYWEEGWGRGVALRRAPEPRFIEAPGVLCVEAAPPRGEETFLVWQESVGSRYQIHAFLIDASGMPRSSIVEGASEMRYAIYPELLETASGVELGWFDLEGGATDFVRKRWSSQTRLWEPAAASASAWPQSALEALPLVTATRAEGLCLLGYRRFGESDRIFLEKIDGETMLIDDAPGAQNRAPAASRSLGDALGAAWQSRSGGETRLDRAVVFPSAGEVRRFPSQGLDPFLAPEPDVALTDAALLTVWIGRFPGVAQQAGAASWETAGVFFMESRRDAGSEAAAHPVGAE